MRTQRTKDQRTTKHQKGTVELLPRNQKRLIERRQETRGIRYRIRENLKRRSIKMRPKPERHKGNPARRRRGEPLNPLTEQRPHFKLNINHRKTTK